MTAKVTEAGATAALVALAPVGWLTVPFTLLSPFA